MLLSVFIFIGFVVLMSTVSTRRWIYANGYVMTGQEVKIRPSVTGVIEKKLVESGTLVEEGQVLIQLNDAVQKAAYEEALGHISAQEAELERLLSAHKLKEEERKSQITRAHLNLELVQRQYERMRDASSGREIFSQADLEEAAFRVRLASSHLKELQISQGPLWKKQVAVLREKIATAKKSVPRLEAELKLRQIVSPLHGTLSFHSFAPGEVVQSEHELGQIFDRDRWIVKLKIPERHIAHVQENQTVKVALAAYPKIHFGYLEGHVSRIEKLVTPRATGDSIFYVEASLVAREDIRLQPGMTAWAYVDAGETSWRIRLLGW